MGARCDFWNDPAVGLVRLVLADDRLGKNTSIRSDQRRGAVVARGFKAEDDFGGGGHFVPGPLPDRTVMH